MKIVHFDRKFGVMKIQADTLDDLWHLGPGILSVSIKDRQNSLSVELDTLSRALSETRIKRLQLEAEQVKLRDEKITRFIGFSAHGYFDKALALIETGLEHAAVPDECPWDLDTLLESKR